MYIAYQAVKQFSQSFYKEETFMSNERILLPKFGATKDKEGNTIWARLPYEFTFTNKEEYLTWRKIWKETYKELSLKIRETKNLRNNSFRNKETDTYKHQYECSKLREQARTLMEILQEGKEYSWTLKRASLGK